MKSKARTKNKTTDERLVEKAGGIIIRKNGGITEFCLVHRPWHNDWSIPKGHMEPGESPVQAAIREVGEETGFHCAVSRELPPFFYTMPAGEPVLTHLFEMQYIDEGLERDDEVDAVVWKPISEALEIITYPALAEYLRDLYCSTRSGATE